MFWQLTALSASSPVDSILDKENFTLEELLDEEEIIQECKALNSRLINFLRDRAQVEQLLQYIVEEPPEDADNKRSFKFPFIACEIFTCEIDVILRTLAEEEELMNLLFSFLEPNRPHSALLAGYFSKVVVCLMLRKTVPLMNYVQVHQDVFCQLVDLIGITSIMEVLVRLVAADDHVYPNFSDVMQWLADSNLLEMIVDKLSPSCAPEVHANAAETLCAITRNVPSALATKLSSPSFVARIFGHALEDSHSKSGLVNSLSVCISLLDPKRSAINSSLMYSFRNQLMYEPPIPVNSETINAMLPQLGDLLMLLSVSSDEKILPTTYGELRPPLGKHRLKIVEFIAVLLRTGNEAAQNELVNSGAIRRVLDLFFEYPYNNALHHHVESIILSCLESKNDAIVDHLLQECDLIGKFLQTDKHQILSSNSNQPTLVAAGKRATRVGNIGHITRISNKLVQLGCSNSCIQACLQEQGALDRDDEDVYFDDESAEVVISSLRLGDEQGSHINGDYNPCLMSSLFTNSNWFAFQDDRTGNAPATTSPTDVMTQMNLNGTANGVVSFIGWTCMVGYVMNEFNNFMSRGDLSPQGEKANATQDMGFFRFETTENELFGDRSLPEWVRWGEYSDLQVGGSSKNPFLDDDSSDVNLPSQTETMVTDVAPPLNGESVLPSGSSDSMDLSEGSEGSDTNQKSPPSVPSLFEEDVEFVGVELEGTEKAMEQALKEGIVGEAGPLKRSSVPKVPEKENPDDDGAGMKEFNDSNYWRVDQEVSVSE
ncbi:hypothetical protein GOBAR_AA13676 [Gossypium barbadense]|uniref:Uncharacterized protein n=1 Tax=Gossypium barbadense TaxID=3634 RepID=A0A2P5XUH8_GOSBA|nr:hypothetical protein GOBAR_AA13676 [Gossypium barbadense]